MKKFLNTLLLAVAVVSGVLCFIRLMSEPINGININFVIGSILSAIGVILFYKIAVRLLPEDWINKIMNEKI